MSDYHYRSPHQMTPLLPSDRKMEALRPLAAELIAQAKDLPAQGLPHLRQLLRETLRPMNSYYTNKIEGQQTEPLLIEQALKQDFSAQPDEARKQRIAIAHIETECWGEAEMPRFTGPAIFSAPFVQSIHHHLHSQLTKGDLIQHGEDGSDMAPELVVPGQFRERGVKVGNHIPPDPASVPDFMQAWAQGYQHQHIGESAVIALMAAHQRLAWIHPFADGNGRTSRLHTHIGLNALGLTQGLWSPMRGLARQREAYYANLSKADCDRQGDYDGRGVLSERGLVDFITFFIEVCLDQVQFMDSMLRLDDFEAHLTQMLAAESTKEATRYLKIEAAIPLAYLGTVQEMDRTRFKGMMGLAARTADRVLADLFKLGIVSSKSPKGPVELALPMHLFRYLFPRLWPEAESQT
jgi:Fic family protein